MKKVFSLIFALALILALAACGGKEAELLVVPTESPAVTEPAQSSPAPVETPESSAGPVHDPKAEADPDPEAEREALLTGLLEDFAQAYFYGTAEDVKPYLSAGFSEAVESYPMLSGEQPSELEIQYLSPLEDDPDRYTASIRFISGAEDSYTYLAVDLVRESGSWFVEFYGLQK